MYGLFPLLLFIRLLLLAVAGASNSVAQKMYICDNTTKACILHKGEVISSDIAMAQSTCLMICAGGSIWPYPTGFVSIDEAYAAFYIDKVTIHFGTDGDAGLTSEFLKLSSSIKAVFLDGLRDIQKSQYSLSNDGTEGAALTITVKITDPSVTAMTLRVEESYSLVITRTSSGSSSSDGGKIEVIITAETLFGARHGMETLRQLISWDELLASLVVASGVQILKDKPSFPYRGAMIDISRSFIPIDKLKNAVRALSFNKMNVLHLHLSDTAAFPLEIKKQPNVTFFGAYSEKDMILQDEMIGSNGVVYVCLLYLYADIKQIFTLQTLFSSQTLLVL
jgi:hexosaminidase